MGGAACILGLRHRTSSDKSKRQLGLRRQDEELSPLVQDDVKETSNVSIHLSDFTRQRSRPGRQSLESAGIAVNESSSVVTCRKRQKQANPPSATFHKRSRTACRDPHFNNSSVAEPADGVQVAGLRPVETAASRARETFALLVRRAPCRARGAEDAEDAVLRENACCRTRPWRGPRTSQNEDRDLGEELGVRGLLRDDEPVRLKQDRRGEHRRIQGTQDAPPEREI